MSPVLDKLETKQLSKDQWTETITPFRLYLLRFLMGFEDCLQNIIKSNHKKEYQIIHRSHLVSLMKLIVWVLFDNYFIIIISYIILTASKSKLTINISPD